MAGVKGRSGRKPKPTAVLKLTGQYRPDRHEGTEPQPAVGIPEPPKSLTGEALAEWDRITRLLVQVRCIAELDRSALAAYCIEWAKYIKANNRLRVINSLLTESTKGTRMPHPLLRVSDRALANMLRLCQEFGLTPAARSRLNVEAGQSSEDPLERLIREQAQRRRQAPAG
jgi:P27 family predicted phage terminase small subunit